MCLGRCSRFIARCLYPLGFLSMTCNIVLFFPDWKTEYALNHRLTPEVTYMGGLVGGGVMVLVLAFYIDFKGCCSNRCEKFLSISIAAGGVAGAIYSFKVAFDGLVNGPYCRAGSWWDKPYKDKSLKYLLNVDQWDQCSEPENVVALNSSAFGLLVLASSLELVLCSLQLVIVVVTYVCKTEGKRVGETALRMVATGR
ncbi:transmembrane 4 L6 family member 5-like isoform X2 [Salminus brasiliensis]|uniref:transmembrane 4 L6 family member 5-like isoform X2 n=1 Tax=Salminus brasiliensis TaxID=930266 RepID=UPI003B8393A9